MAQDFAKQRNNPDGNKRKHSASKSPTSGNANWSWYFSGLMTGVIISIAAYLGVLKLGEGVTEGAQNVQTNPEELPAFRFGFYNELANAEVAVNVPPVATEPGTDAVAGNPAPATTSATTEAPTATQDLASADAQRPVLYLWQVGSFQNREDAESLRARILLMNMSVNVSQGVVNGRTFYRVQVGPIAGRQNAEAARDILSQNGIDSMLLQLP